LAGTSEITDGRDCHSRTTDRRRCRRARARATIAFANGCFDLLHVGHVRYLEAAAAEADRLIVAINDDESVERLKGKAGRSWPARAGRARRRAALRRLRRRVSGADRGPLLEALRPDVHCKGTDYTVESVPERAIVEAYGGRTAIVGDPKDHSTRDLLGRIVRTVS
jgi:rfaE bifunctional protein nucleotidyltransferase chain/domain